MTKVGTLHDILLALDPRGIEDLPAELGAFSVESLCVRFNFTRQQHLEALAAVGASSELPAHVKTVIHETTHLFYTSTTPLGLLIHRLRRLQARLVINAIREIVRDGIQLNFPLYTMVGGVSGKAAEGFDTSLRIWYAVEIYILTLLGEIETLERHLKKNTLINTVHLTEMFSIIQYYLTIHIHEVRCGSLFDDLLRTDIVYEHEDFDSLAQEKVWGMILRAGGGGANTLGIIESAGIASEYYGSRSLDLEVWKKRISAKPWARSAPQTWLLWASEIRARTLGEFVHAYLGICELALFGALLPEYRRLRVGKIDLRELLPFTRWFKLVKAASNIDPPTSSSDYRRYVDNLSEAAGWPTITQIAELAVEGGNTDPVEQIYRKAQQMRVEQPSIFLNYPSFVLSAAPEHVAMLCDFEFPVIKYTDKTLFLTDKATLNNLLIYYLGRLATRKLVLKDRIDLPLPFDASDEEKGGVARDVHEMLSSASGAKIPEVRIL